MTILPPTFSARWLIVLVVTALLWTGAGVLAAYLNTGDSPTLEKFEAAAAALSGIAAVPALFGFFGARLAFLVAHLGLLVGYALMLQSFGGPATQGFEDLAAVALFIMLGLIGLGLGLVADIVRYFLKLKRNGASNAA